MMSKTVNVGLIGFGLGGRVFHAPIITSVQGLNLSKIRETKADNIEIIKKRYPEAEIVNDSKELFSDERLDLIVIATPNIHHYPLAKEALNAGKHVVVDKPFTISTAEADELIALAEKKGKIISVHHNRRWDSNSLTVEKIIQSKVLGNIVEYEAHYDRFRNFIRPNSWKEENKPGTGILYDLGPHLVYQAVYLFGKPDTITADIRTQREGGKSIDNFEIILDYKNLKVSLNSGLLLREPRPSVAVYGDQGCFVKNGMDVQEQDLMAGLVPNETPSWGVEPETLWGKLNTTINGLHVIGNVESEAGDYRKYYDNVYKAIIGEEELLVKTEHSRDTVRIIELALQSHEEKRTVKFSK